MSQHDESIVIDRAKSSWSDLWKKEDYWAIWVGLAIAFFAMFLILPSKSDFVQKIQAQNDIISVEKAKPYDTVALVEAKKAKKAIMGGSLPAMKEFKSYFYSPVGYVFIGLFLIMFSIFFYTDVFNYQSTNFEYIFYSGATILTFIVPILTMRTMAEERKSGTGGKVKRVKSGN